MNRMSKSGCDQELPSELNEPLINLLLLHIVAPFVEENNPSYILQVNGEELWKWREVSLAQTAFDLVQTAFGTLDTSSKCRRRIVSGTLPKILENSKEKWKELQREKRKRMRAETWVKLNIKLDEIKQTLKDVLTQLTEENVDLRATIEEKAANLYWKMKEQLTHRGKDFTQVGDKQQRRHLTQIQLVVSFIETDPLSCLFYANCIRIRVLEGLDQV